MNKFRFKVGDRVRVKNDLVVGGRYFMEDGETSDIFSHGMSENVGKEATIIAIECGKYHIDIDVIHKYTDSMIKKLVDSKSRGDYEENVEVEDLLNHMIKQFPKQKERISKEQIEKEINHAIDTGNKEEFLRLSKKYFTSDNKIS